MTTPRKCNACGQPGHYSNTCGRVTSYRRVLTPRPARLDPLPAPARVPALETPRLEQPREPRTFGPTSAISDLECITCGRAVLIVHRERERDAGHPPIAVRA